VGFARYAVQAVLVEGRGWWEWATDITGLTWVNWPLFGAISQAIGLDFPHCC
jgi:hypothetical protein